MPKPTLILLHGALGASAQFQPWIPLLTDAFDVHTLDFEGHGAQPFAGRGFAIPHFAENLEQYIHAKGLERPHVFGYSMGGYVALWLAARKPALLGKVFTFASKLGWTPEGAAREVKMLDVATILEKVPKFAQMLEARHHGNEWRQHLALTAEMMVGLGDAPALTAADYSKVAVPVRLGVGDRDTMVTLEETAAAYRLIPGAELLVLPNTPHPIEKMDPARICRQIVEFFG